MSWKDSMDTFIFICRLIHNPFSPLLISSFVDSHRETGRIFWKLSKTFEYFFQTRSLDLTLHWNHQWDKLRILNHLKLLIGKDNIVFYWLIIIFCEDKKLRKFDKNLSDIPLVTQFWSTKNCIAKEVSTVF